MLRLDHVLARNLGLSRRVVTRLLRAGEVRAPGGETLSDPGGRIEPGRLPLEIEVEGVAHLLHAEFHLMQHKPAGCVTALHDGRHATAFALLEGAPLHAELRAVGRLDKDTSGLLLWTTDGQRLHRLTHPRFAVPRTYQAALARPFAPPPSELRLRDGHVVHITSLSTIRRAALHPGLVPPPEATVFAELVLTGGAYHEVRRIFAALGSHVLALHRIRHGAITLPTDLEPGQWRPLAAAALESHVVPAGLARRNFPRGI